MCIVVAHVDKRLCVFIREAGNQAMVWCQSIVKFIDRRNSTVTHDIAKKIDWLGNKKIYNGSGGKSVPSFTI